MCVADVSFAVDNTIQRHASQLEKLHSLPVFPGNQVIRVRQTDKGNAFILPVLLESWHRVWPNGQDLHAAVYKLFILISQARQLRAAIRSHKAPQEGKHNRFPAEIR